MTAQSLNRRTLSPRRLPEASWLRGIRARPAERSAGTRIGSAQSRVFAVSRRIPDTAQVDFSTEHSGRFTFNPESRACSIAHS